MGWEKSKSLKVALYLGLSVVCAAKPVSKQAKKTKEPTSERSSNLSLMYNAWAINVNSVNGKGYLKAADSLTKEEYEALKLYLKPVATDPVKEFKDVQNIAQDSANVQALFGKLEAKTRLTPADTERWKDNLNRLHKRLLAALERRVGDDEDYREFLKAEQARALGNYQVAHAARSALSKYVSVIDDKNNTVQIELWAQVLKDPHTEMLIRMRQGVEIAHATFLDFEKQRFMSPENQNLKAHANDTVNVDSKQGDDPTGMYLRKGQAPYSKGPNPLLPPPIED